MTPLQRQFERLLQLIPVVPIWRSENMMFRIHREKKRALFIADNHNVTGLSWTEDHGRVVQVDINRSIELDELMVELDNVLKEFPDERR